MHIKILETKSAKVSYVFYLHSLPLLFRQTRSVEKSIFFCRIIIKRFILITIDNACSRYYSKVQDWCRNSCECCPCSCCKTINVELSVEIIDDKIIKKKDKPYGYGRISSYQRPTRVGSDLGSGWVGSGRATKILVDLGSGRVGSQNIDRFRTLR